MSSSAADNEFLRLLGGSPANGDNQRLDKRVQYTFIGISFYTVVVGALGIAAGYSSEHCMTYFVSTISKQLSNQFSYLIL